MPCLRNPIIRGTVVCPNPRCQAEIEYERDPAFECAKPWPGSPWASTRDKDVGDYPCLVELPPWQNPRGLLAAASSLEYWIQLDEFWFRKGEPRAIHREIVAAYHAYTDVRERALFQTGYHNADEESTDGLVDRLSPLDLKRASEKEGVIRAGTWTHRMADLPLFAENPNLPYTVNELHDMGKREDIPRWAQEAARFRAQGSMQSTGIKPTLIPPWS